MTRVAAAVAAAWALLACGPARHEYKDTRVAMGTVVSARAVAGDEAAARRAVEAAFAEVARAERVASYADAGSELSRLNREAGNGPVTASAELLGLVTDARELAAATGGYFDPTVAPAVELYGIKDGAPRWPPEGEVAVALGVIGYEGIIVDAERGTVAFARPGMALDLSAIAKGWAADRAAAAMARAGARAGIVEAGGEVVCFGGGPRPGRLWRVGVKNPRGPGLYAAFDLAGGACATSGDYEQRFNAGGRVFTHLFDPHTGRPAANAASVTVVAPTCAAADAWATAFMVMPAAEAARRLGQPGAPAALVITAADGGLKTACYGDFPALTP